MHKTFKMKSQFVKDYIENQNHEYYIKEDNNLVELLDNIFRAIDGEKSKIVDFEEGYRTHRVIEDLIQEK